MTMTIDLSPDMKARFDAEAAKNGQEPEDYLLAGVNAALMPDADDAQIDAGWDSLTALVDRCQMDTGITDLAHQHDHYIHGKAKRE